MAKGKVIWLKNAEIQMFANGLLFPKKQKQNIQPKVV
jgi:hypothetical protein